MLSHTHLKSTVAALCLMGTGLLSSLAVAPMARAQTDSGPNCVSPRSQIEFNICAARAHELVDGRLNRVYQQQLRQLGRGDRDRLIDAELAWIQFRDAECEFRASKYEGGSIHPMIYHGCMTELTQQRTTELQNPYSIDESYAASDRYLNRSYQSVRRNTSARILDNLIDAQLAWIDYRDTNCAYEGQSQITYPLNRNQCLARMSNQRATDLLRVEEGDF